MPAKGWRKSRVIETGDPEGFMAMLNRYEQWLRTHHYARGTLKSARDQLLLFMEWCSDRGLSRPVEVDRAILERYQKSLFHHRMANGKRLRVSTQRNRLTQVTLFFRWLTRCRFLLYNPASELQLPRPEQRLPGPVLTVAELEGIINQTDVYTPLGLRDRAIMEVFYSTGIRRLELVQLKLNEIDLEEATLFVRQGKGGQDRLLPIGERALAWLDRYLVEVRPTLVLQPDDGSVFLSGEKKPFHPDSVGHLLKKYFKAAGIERRGVCHQFRHSMATLMLEGGADIRYVQQMLGHSSLEATKVYTRVSLTKLKEVHRLTHPANRTSA